MRISRAAVLSLVVNNASAFSTTQKPAFSNFLQTSTRTPAAKTQSTRLMCGLIAAIDDVWSDNTSSDDSQIPLLDDKELLNEATSILYHRGPDGMTCSSGKIGGNNAARWAMGHTRLAIVDPNNRKADMPFELDFEVEPGTTKKIKLAANGEIYNHKQLYNNMQEDGWKHDRVSGSDCEVIAHSFAKYGGPATAAKLDGMFAFVVFEENEADGTIQAFAARDPVGIKPLYLGRALNAEDGTKDASGYVFGSELKALVGHVVPESVLAIPAGHYWTPEEGLVCFYNPDWLRKDDFAPWDTEDHTVTSDELRGAFTAAIQKRMMADVDYGFFLSGGVDSAVVAHVLMPLYRDAKLAEGGEFTPIPTFTVGMENSPDVMAAKAVVENMGGSKYIDHKIRYFTPDEVFDTIPKIIYHMETYEAELIRSSIPNWFLAEAAAKDVKMVLTGEGSDELFAGYLYFQDAENKMQVQNELKRIYGMLGNINLHRTDRMTMAHGLEARVPFLDTEFTKLVMSVDPAKKEVDPDAVKNNARGREKTLLRELFEGPNANGDLIPEPVLWRAKAMQCEGVGEDWVSILQKKVTSMVPDEDFARATEKFPLNTPQTKEEFYYRQIFEDRFAGMDHVITPWEGGGRAMGAAWKSDLYTREGLKNVDLLSHSLQEDKSSPTILASSPGGINGGSSSRSTDFSRLGFSGSANQANGSSSPKSPRFVAATDAIPETRTVSDQYVEEARNKARMFGYSEFEQMLTTGGDDRSIILENSGANKYHIKPQPVADNNIFRGSCTGNPPTRRGYNAAKELYETRLMGLQGSELTSALSSIFEEQRNRLARYLQLPEGAEVIICPSGSDAEYIPVAIAKCLHPTKNISNGISQLNEIGAGSAPASTGKYFSTHAPFLGENSNECLSGFDDIDGIVVPARAADGSVIDSSQRMGEFLHQQLAAGNFPILHGVFGGKTGVRDMIMPGSIEQGDVSLGVVDACQGRFTAGELQAWLEQDSLVLFTGSKFYQAPPFCAAVIVPSSIASKLNALNPPKDMLVPSGLGAFLTDKELSSCLNNWKPYINSGNNNAGLALRWEAGLAGIEAIASIPDGDRMILSDEWAAAVRAMVDSDEMLDTFSVERSIVSIRIGKKIGGWLDMKDARDLYRWMSLDVSSAVADLTAEEIDILSTPAYIGQPVSVSESYAIVRIALGVESLLDYAEDRHRALQEDEKVVKKLGVIAKYFDILQSSGL